MLIGKKSNKRAEAVVVMILPVYRRENMNEIESENHSGKNESLRVGQEFVIHEPDCI